MFNPSPSKRWSVVVESALIALVLAGLVLLYRPAYYVPGSRMDEAALLVYPEQMLHGKIPYRDFETFYGPANLWILAGTFQVLGISVATERCVGAVYRLALLAALYFVARKWGKIAAVGAVAIAAFVLLPMALFANAWVMALALALGSIALLAAAFGQPDNRPLAAVSSGLLGGAAILFRADLAPAIVLSAAILLCTAKRRQLVAWVIGAAAALAPMLYYVLFAGWRPVADNLFLYPVLYSNAGRRLALANEPAETLIYIGLMIAAGLLAMTTGGIATWKRKEDRSSITLLALGTFALLTLPQAIQRADRFHLAMVAPVTVALLPILAAAALKFLHKPTLCPWFAALATIACFSVLFSVAPQPAELLTATVKDELVISELPEYRARAGSRTFPLSSPDDARRVTKICAALGRDACAGERLFVGPRDLRRTNYNDVYFYHLLPQLAPASYFIEMNPFSANRLGSRLATDIATADWLILDSHLDTFHEANASERMGPEAPMVVVRDRFVQVAQLEQFSIFRRRTGL
jgi:hypothetical protein